MRGGRSGLFQNPLAQWAASFNRGRRGQTKQNTGKNEDAYQHHWEACILPNPPSLCPLWPACWPANWTAPLCWAAGKEAAAAAAAALSPHSRAEGRAVQQRQGN
jgi:hypothetical protein